MAEAIEGKASEAAERYAQAAFELARDQGALDQIEKDLRVFLDAIRETPDLRTAVHSPLIDAVEKSRALVMVAEKLGLSALGRNLIGVVARNGRAGELAGLAKAFGRRLATHRGASQVEIVSARPLEAGQLSEITTALGKALGRNVEPIVSVDESLIGGFIARAGSRQFDASLKTKLDSLKLALKGA